MPGSRAVRSLAVVLTCWGAGGALGQDSQYWNLQYGPVAELLGGVVVGSSRDLSATYYNPGALALTKKPSLVASVDSFEATRLKASAEAPLNDLEDMKVRPSPSLFAVALPRSLTGSHTLAISGLTRQDLDLRVDNWRATATGVAGEALFDQSMSENWFGLSWAHPAGRSVGLGATTYVAYRGQRTRRELSGSAALSASQGAAALLVDDFDYSNYRLLWKAGIAAQLDSWDLGLTVTTASVGLFGRGEAAYTRSLVGSDIGGGPVVSVASQYEDDLESRYESPWSVALGGAHRRGPNTFHAAVEWFDSVPAFEVLDTTPFQGAPGAASLVKRLGQQAKSVVNFGFGYERRVSERSSWYGAFTTDFTFADTQDAGENALSTWNIYHVTAGTAVRVGNAKLTMGATYAFGSDDRTIAVFQVLPGGPPALAQAQADVSFSRLRVLVGFDFGQ